MDNYDQILSTSLSYYRKTLQDVILKMSAFWVTISGKGKKREIDGGVKIVVPLMYGKNTTVKSFDGYDTVDITPQEGIGNAKFEWKQIAGSIIITKKERRQNSGVGRIIDLFASKVKQLELSLTEEMNTQVFADGTGNGGKNIAGLALYVADLPTSGVVGEIDRAAKDWWRNKYNASDLSTAVWGGTTDTALTAIGQMYRDVSKGNEHPDLLLMTSALFGKYEGTCQPMMRFTDNRLADLGFENLKYKGAVMMFDDLCPAKHLYFLNTNHFEWTVDSESNFVNTPLEHLPQQPQVDVSYVLAMGNLVIDNCARQGVITNIA